MPRHESLDALPENVQTRVRRRRAKMTANSIWLTHDNHAEVGRTADAVLSVAALSDRGERNKAKESLRELRTTMRAGAELWIIDRTEPWPKRRFARSEARSSSPLVDAIRSAGWTIASIDRFTCSSDDDGSEEQWVDLVAIDLAARESTGLGEGDGDQRRKHRDHQKDS